LEGYSAEQASRLTGADYHNILYWLRSGLVQASHSPNRKPKPRHPIRFSRSDLLEIGIIQELRERDTPVQRVRKALDVLRNFNITQTLLLDLTSSLPAKREQQAFYLDVSSDDVHLYCSKNEVLSVVKHQGQKVIHFLIVDILEVCEELRGRLVDMQEEEVLTQVK
jgi:DNA-binding transcriptional MerR regulator